MSTVLSFVSHQLRKLKAYFRSRGFLLLVPGAEFCFFLLQLHGPSMVHGCEDICRALPWFCIQSAQSFCDPGQALLTTSLQPFWCGYCVFQTLCYSSLWIPTYQPRFTCIPESCFLVPGIWGPVLASATRELLCHVLGCNQTFSSKVWPPAMGRGTSSKVGLPCILSVISRFPVWVLFIFS